MLQAVVLADQLRFIRLESGSGRPDAMVRNSKTLLIETGLGLRLGFFNSNVDVSCLIPGFWRFTSEVLV